MKKQLLIALLCACVVLGNSVAAFAQGKDKQSETKAETHVFVRQNGQVVEVPPGSVVTGEPGQGNRVQFSVSGGGVVTANGGAPQVQIIQNEFSFDSAVVKGAPYAADAVTETVQTLGDGNRIVRNSAAKAYRDSAGRTRREQALNVVGAWSVSGAAPKMIYISDPVAGVHYSLDPRTKTATKINVQRITNVSGDNVVITNGAGGIGRLTVRGEHNGDHPVRGEHNGDHPVRGEHNGDHVRFVTDDNRTVVLSGEAEVGAKSAAGGVVSGVTTSGGNVFTFVSEGDANRESLGTQTIEGVRAEGTRVTFTIPAGKIGNERPIATVSERWYSPELQAVVMSKTSDPRSGETTYRLSHLVRSEPDPTLFQVPADYTIKEGGFSFNTGAAEVLKKIEAERKAKKPNDN